MSPESMRQYQPGAITLWTGNHLSQQLKLCPVRILLMYDDLMQSCLVPRGVPGRRERGPGQACVLAQTGSAPCALPTGPAWPPVARPSRLHGFRVRVAWVRARFYGRGTLNINRPDERHARDDNAVGQHCQAAV